MSSLAPAIVRGQFSDLFGSSMLPVLEEIFRYNIDLARGIADQIFKTVSHDRDIWQYTEIADLPLFVEMAEGEEYSFMAPKQGFDKTLSIIKYGMGASISEEAIDDGKFDMVRQILEQLARAASETREQTRINILNNGFGSETTADGNSLFNSAHSLPSGATFRNQLATASDLSETSLQQAMTDFETQFVSDNGSIVSIRPSKLVVHSSNKRLARELVGSELKPETADNNMNSLKDDGLMVLSSPRLTDTDAWFLVADPADNGLRVVDRMGIQSKAKEEFDTDSIKYKSRYREKVAAVHPFGCFGTPGA